VLKADHFKADNSAITVDISLHGAEVRTNLALVPGEWVGVVPKGEFPHAIPTHVVWVREDEASRWTFAGLEFLDHCLALAGGVTSPHAGGVGEFKRWDVSGTPANAT
jgi:hypothetical protein